MQLSCLFTIQDMACEPRSYTERNARVTSTAGASAKGTAIGFSILKRRYAFWSSSLKKNSNWSSCTTYSMRLSSVSYDVAETS
jgi:hypothetical protein